VRVGGSVIDQDVNATEGVDSALYQCTNRVLVAHVCGYGKRFATSIRDLCSDCLQSLLFPAG
jgi:hypothetical protein